MLICEFCRDEILPEERDVSYSWVPLGLDGDHLVTLYAHEECWEDLHPFRKRAIGDLSLIPPAQGGE